MNSYEQIAATRLLECPACGGPLDPPTASGIFDADFFGTLRCDCSEYPVLAGIPVIMKGRLPDADTDTGRLAELVRSGRPEQALHEAIAPRQHFRERVAMRRVMPGSMVRRFRNARLSSQHACWLARFHELARDQSPGSTIRLILHYFGEDRRRAANYFAYRAGQPKYLVTLSLLRLREDPDCCSLDIGCGAGQITRILASEYAPERAVGIDANFFLLWLANTRVAPESTFICADVERGLPFRDSAFGFQLLSNFYHYLYEKRLLLTEAKRVGAPDSTLVISSLRTGIEDPGVPQANLDPSSYRRLCETHFDAARFVAESEVLKRAISGCDESLTSAPMDELDDQTMIDLVLSDRVRAPDNGLAEWTTEARRYRVNPLYRQCAGPVGSTMTLERRWPGDEFTADNPEMPGYLPERMELSAPIAAALAEQRYVAEMAPLVRTGVLVDLPACY